MIGNFASEEDLFVFLEEGDLEALESGSLEGIVADSEASEKEPGELLLRYVEEYKHSRPGVALYDGSGVPDVEVVIGPGDYDNLVDGEVYDDGIGSFQEIPRKNAFKVVPPEARNGYEDLYEAVKY